MTKDSVEQALMELMEDDISIGKLHLIRECMQTVTGEAAELFLSIKYNTIGMNTE